MIKLETRSGQKFEAEIMGSSSEGTIIIVPDFFNQENSLYAAIASKLASLYTVYMLRFPIDKDTTVSKVTGFLEACVAHAAQKHGKIGQLGHGIGGTVCLAYCQKHRSDGLFAISPAVDLRQYVDKQFNEVQLYELATHRVCSVSVDGKIHEVSKTFFEDLTQHNAMNKKIKSKIGISCGSSDEHIYQEGLNLHQQNLELGVDSHFDVIQNADFWFTMKQQREMLCELSKSFFNENLRNITKSFKF